MTDTTTALKTIRSVRQTRRFTSEPVAPEALDKILEVARWSGSSQNRQPWHFIVVRDRERIRQLSEVRDAINWAGTGPVAIAIVLDGGRKISEAYDEGRVTERIMIAANLLGLGSAVAWYGDASQQARAKAILGVPEEATARSVIAIGHPDRSADQRSPAAEGGRKPLSEIVSHERYVERG